MLPQHVIEILRDKGYHPRSDKAGNAIGEAIVIDLMGFEKVAEAAAAGKLVFAINHKLHYGSTGEWKTDLAIGWPGPDGPEPGSPTLAGMARSTPNKTFLAIESKATMTKHSGAKKNRKGDIDAHHQHVHAYDAKTIAGSVSLINAADVFKSPLLDTPTIHTTSRRTAKQSAKTVIDEVMGIPMSSAVGQAGLDVRTVLVVEMDNINLPSTRFLDPGEFPAPAKDHPLNWDNFIFNAQSLLLERWLRDL